MTIPNLITVARLVMVPLIVVMILQGRWGAAFTLFVIAGASDAIDGFIARRFDMRSQFGAYLDPIADKALLVSIYITLTIAGVLPAWLAVVIVSRDIMIVSAVLLSWVMAKPVEIAPSILSKVNTAAQIAFAAIVLSTKAFGVDLGGFDELAMLTLAALTVISLAPYVAWWLRHMAG